jgi:hypothetical protein
LSSNFSFVFGEPPDVSLRVQLRLGGVAQLEFRKGEGGNGFAVGPDLGETGQVLLDANIVTGLEPAFEIDVDKRH